LSKNLGLKFVPNTFRPGWSFLRNGYLEPELAPPEDVPAQDEHQRREHGKGPLQRVSNNRVRQKTFQISKLLLQFLDPLKRFYCGEG
jgi:hypothetical protein